MDIKELLNDDNAVSPVIGVILMVAITVILAAVIASFVLGLGDQAQNTTPTASFNFDWDDSTSSTSDLKNTSDSSGSELTITHDSGDDLESENLEIKDDDGQSVSPFTGTVSAGTSVTIGAGNDDTVRIIWTDPEGGSTSTLTTYEAPDA